MTLVSLPLTQNYPWYEFTCALGGVSFTFEMRFNIRINRWIMCIKDSSGNPVLAGVPLLINRPLLAQYPTLPLPDGEMMVLDNTGQGNQPTLGSFLTTHSLYFYSP